MSAGTACTQSFLIPVQILDLEPSQESVWSSSTGQCRGSKQRQQLVRKSGKGFSTERWFWWQVCDKQFQPSVEWMRQDCFWILSKTLLQLLSWEVFLKNLWRMGGLLFQMCLLFKKKSAPATSRRFTSTASCQDFHLAVHRYQNWRSVATYGDLELTSSQDLHSVCIWSLPYGYNFESLLFLCLSPQIPPSHGFSDV